ncbi:MAG: hypothetical protein AAGA48_31440 [Myxococcota bacterium]
MQGIALGLCIVGTATVVISLRIEGLSVPSLLGFVVGGIVVLGGGLLLQEYAKRLRGEVFDRSGSLGATVLYLRPFTSDDAFNDAAESGIQGGPFFLLNPRTRTLAWLFVNRMARFEELLAYAYRHIAKVIAIGNPSEHLPHSGAARWYVTPGQIEATGDDWQREVVEEMRRAMLVVLHTGTSPGLLWEVEAVIANVDPERFVIFVGQANHRNLADAMMAQVSPPRATERAWDAFRAACQDRFPVALPTDIGAARFIRFDSDWTPHLLAPVVTRLAWGLPGPRAPTEVASSEGALEWLNWILVPEPFGRQLLRDLLALCGWGSPCFLAWRRCLWAPSFWPHSRRA